MKQLGLILCMAINGISYLLITLLIVGEYPYFVDQTNLALYALGLPAVLMLGVLGMFSLNK